MINAIFEYKEQKIVIQCFSKDKFVDICKKFSNKINEGDYDKKLYIYNNKPLNLDLTLNEQIDLIEVLNSQELKILVYDTENYVKINYSYEGRNSFIIAKNEESFLEKAASKLKKPFGRLVFLFNGRNASKEDSKKNFNQLSNEQNKKDKSINLLIMDNDDDENNEEEKKENQENQENQEGKENKKEIKNENNKENDNEEGNENEEENKEENKVFFVYELNPFFNKLYLFLIIQFFIIETLSYLAFKKDFNEKFIYSNKATIYYFCSATLLASLAAGGCFSENENRLKYGYFYFILYILIILLFCFLLSKYIEEYNYILCTLSLFLFDFIAMKIYIMIFNKYKGFIYFFICLLINLITILIFYYEFFSKQDKKAIMIISIIALLKIIYIILFNYEVENNFNDDEVFYAIRVFNYVLFTPGFLIIIISILLAIVGVIIGVIVVIFLVVFVILLIYLIVINILNSLKFSF